MYHFLKKNLFRLAAAAMILSPAAAAARLVSHEERLDAIARARVRRPVDVAAMDPLAGPEPRRYRLDEEVRCEYEERDPLRPIGGHSKKFPCRDAAGTRLKVKYDPVANGEVFGEVAGTRLFWALGFYAEIAHSVKILCDNCPPDPFLSSAAPRALRTFWPATIQTKLPGEPICEVEDEGWNIDDLDLIDESRGGSGRADADALKLLLVFVNHADDTANQQKLLCAPEDKDCEHPLMFVTDLGGTFGGRDGVTSYRGWAKRSEIWADAAQCVARFEGTYPGFKDPKIGEAGRALLAGLLGKLSDKQIADLFKSARFDVLSAREPAILAAGGKSRPVTIPDWVELFKKKRAQIAEARCPS